MNHVLMGKNFLRTYEYEYCPGVNMEVYCASEEDLVRQLKRFIRFREKIELLLNKEDSRKS